MPRLTGVMHRLGGRPGDRGAVAALVGLLLAGGVLLGMAALVVDVGLLYVEREELQTGADAAAMAVAKACVDGSSGCTASDAVADDYASANAKDHLANATVCGFVPANPAILNCDPPVGNLTDCIGPRPAPSTPYVEVRTTTEVPGGTALPPVFAGAITGTNGARVAACSRVSWGPVASASTAIGMAISRDKFNEATDSGGVFQPPPADGEHDEDLDDEREIQLKWRPGPAPGTGGGLADGFVWIESGGGRACAQDFEVGKNLRASTDARTPSGCGARLQDVVVKVEPITVGIYEDAGSGEINVVGIAIFVATGWFKPSNWDGGPGSLGQVDIHEPLDNANKCDTAAENFCLYGYFTTKLFATGTGSVSADNFGATYLKTIG